MHATKGGRSKQRVANGVMAALFSLGMALCAHAEPLRFDYLKLLKEAEAQAGAPGSLLTLDTMPVEARGAWLKKHRGALDGLRTMQALSEDATGAALTSVWYDIAIGTPDKYARNKDTLPETARAQDAIEAIVHEARNRQVVILNEAHHVPFHRVFAGKLAHELRKIGFDYLAAEAFVPDMPMHPAAVSQDMGFYVSEPMYGAFVRGALRDGWSFVGYDTNPDAATQAEAERLRETGALGNLMTAIFARNPKAKVFMYVGYGHAKKQPEADAEGWKSIATLLRESLAIEPLTIDQSLMYGRGDVRVDNPLYREAMQRYAPSGPMVLKAATGGYVVSGVTAGSYDMQVFHPDETMHATSGRPLWMERQAGLAPRPVPMDMLPARGRRLIQAFHRDDGPGAIPADMVMVEAGKPAPALMLPKGQFRFSYEE